MPKDSYENRKPEYWTIPGKTAIAKRINYYLAKIKRFIKEMFIDTKLDKAAIESLIDDLANDVLTGVIDKFNGELNAEDQLTNYEDTISKDKKAHGVVQYFQGLGLALTGSLALRKTGTIYRSKEENLHDLDFSVVKPMFTQFVYDRIDEIYNKTIKSKDRTEAEVSAIKSNIFRTHDIGSFFDDHPLIQYIKETYPSFKIDKKFGDIKESLTLTGSIGDHVIDIFFVQNIDLTKNEKGFQDWQDIFKAKG